MAELPAMRLRRLLTLLTLGPLVAAGGGLYWLGEKLVAPAHLQVGSPPPDLSATAVTFESQPDTQIHGWLSCQGNKGLVLLLPGVRSNRLSMIDRARFLHSAGFSTLLVDLQGTGESSGTAITFGARESQDVLAATAFARQACPDHKLAIIGSSLGGAAAVLACPRLKVDALILEAVYPSISKATENRLAIRLGAIGPLLTPLFLLQLQPRIGVRPADLRPIDHIAAAGCPVLVVGGTSDRHTTVPDTLSLYSAASQPKQLWLLEGAGHVDLHRFAKVEYERRILSFLAEALSSPAV
jgi:uncharacterized protein